jgi:hypothetical protein
MNAAFTDIANALSSVLVRDGQAAMTGSLNMGSQNITAIGAGSAANPSLRWGAGDGFYSSASGQLALSLGTVQRLSATDTNITIPCTSNGAGMVFSRDVNTGMSGFRVTNPNTGTSAYATFDLYNGSSITTFRKNSSTYTGDANIFWLINNEGIKLNTSGGTRTLDSAGRFLDSDSKQTSFRATSSASRTTTGTYGSYISEAHDHGTAFDSSTGIFTAPVAGVYLFTYIFEATLNTAGGYCQANLVCSTAGTLATLTIAQTRTASDTFTTSASHIVKLAVNETVKVNNAGNSAVVSSYCRDFGGYLLG